MLAYPLPLSARIEAVTLATLDIEGMSCAHCLNAVNRALAALPGVQVESVSLMTGEATVDFDPAAVTPERLVAAIRDTGYGAELPRAGATAEAAFESKDQERDLEAATLARK